MNVDYAETMRLIKKHLWGPVGSVLFHILLLVLLVTFSVGTTAERAPEVEVTMMETKADTLDKIDEVVKKELEKVETPPQETTIDRPDVATVSTMDVPSDAPGSGAGNADGAGIGSGDPSLSAGFEMAVAKSPLVMKGLYAQRTAAGRKGALSAFGGSRHGEDAVLRALRWLKANQDADGSWHKADATSAPAMAGLALLCFLAHGETPSSAEFGQTVEKAMKYLVSTQKPNGGFGGNAFSQHGVYEHGICTYAVTEAFGLTKIMALKEAMDKGIALIIDNQFPNGGYNYAYKGPRWDMSVAGWQFQALKAAKMAGCSNEKLEEAINKGIDFLRKVAHQPGQGFGYANDTGGPSGASSASMTGAGTLCLQLLGKPDCVEVRSGLKWLSETKSPILDVVWVKPEAGAANAKEDRSKKVPVYAWYYITQAKFQKGGKEWQEWNPKFSTTVIRNQIVEGTLGHWEGGDWGRDVYTTAMCCLMLEVYYRYLPTFKHVEATAEGPAAAKSDDVVVDVK